LLIGGIDLSVGPLLGLSVVIGSFFLSGDSGVGFQALGWVAILGGAAGIGVVNWLLVDPLKLHPMVATLSTFMAVQAVSLTLRPTPAGMIDDAVMDLVGSRLGWIPVTFVIAVVLALVMEFVLYRRKIGLSFRGFGSRPEAARVAGVAPRRVQLLAYVGCSLFAALAGMTLLQQVGIGDPRAGLSYTLSSIAAVVIGGASLFGGRGSFVGALLGALFIVQVNAVTNFLGLNQAWQSYLLGGMILIAVSLYSKSRQMAVTA
jgi:ribose transport system ATP-binding protein